MKNYARVSLYCENNKCFPFQFLNKVFNQQIFEKGSFQNPKNDVQIFYYGNNS